MRWLPIEDAPQDGTVIAYVFDSTVVSSCVWLADAESPGWWDVRSDEPANPHHWMPIRLPDEPAPCAAKLRPDRVSWSDDLTSARRRVPIG